MIIKISETEWHDIRGRVTTAYGEKECQHNRLKYIEHGEILLCLDCEKQVTAVWALQKFFWAYRRDEERRAAEYQHLTELERMTVIHRGALLMQEAWRARKHIPTCPHCKEPILAPNPKGVYSVSTHGERAKDARPVVIRPSMGLVEK